MLIKKYNVENTIGVRRTYKFGDMAIKLNESVMKNADRVIGHIKNNKALYAKVVLLFALCMIPTIRNMTGSNIVEGIMYDFSQLSTTEFLIKRAVKISLEYIRIILTYSTGILALADIAQSALEKVCAMVK